MRRGASRPSTRANQVLWLLLSAFAAAAPCAAQVVATRDPSFGSAGLVTTDLGGEEEGSRTLVQPDGTTIVVGSHSDKGGFLVLRYTPSGALDSTFGTGGVVSTPAMGDRCLATHVLVQPNGKIIAVGTAGSEGDSYITVARYEVDGDTDTTFNNPLGATFLQATAASSNTGAAAVLQADEKIVVAGTTWASTYDLVLARYTTLGALDTSFGGGGIVVTDLDGDWDFAHGMVQQADGKIVVVGRTRNPQTSQYDIVVVRFTSAGVLDSTFNGAGYVTTSIGGFDSGYAVALQPGGEIVVAGIADGGDLAVLRYKPTGVLDSTFDGDGIATTPDFEGLDLELLPDGRILVVGLSWDGDENDLAVSCLLPDGSLDPGFDGDGILIEDLGVDDSASGVAFMHDGRVVVSGTQPAVTGDNVVVLRYLGQSGEMVFWDGFEGLGVQWWSGAAGY